MNLHGFIWSLKMARRKRQSLTLLGLFEDSSNRTIVNCIPFAHFVLMRTRIARPSFVLRCHKPNELESGEYSLTFAVTKIQPHRQAGKVCTSRLILRCCVCLSVCRKKSPLSTAFACANLKPFQVVFFPQNLACLPLRLKSCLSKVR